MKVILCTVTLATMTPPALAHNHLTVDTVSGQPGDPVVIVAGYLPAERDYSVLDHRLYFRDRPAQYFLMDRLTQGGDLNGWYAAADLVLTSDFYFATGRLDGGNFKWELASVHALSGGDAVVAWGDFGVGGFVPSALSSASTREGRSFDTMIAGHDHSQGCAFSTAGVFDVTFIAWDSNGVYADSAPVTVRFVVGPHCGSDFNHDGTVNSTDVSDFINQWFQDQLDGTLLTDWDANGVVNSTDVSEFINSWFDDQAAGCG
jgi:hypothetical protein